MAKSNTKRIITRILIVGAGRGGKALLELFYSDPTVQIVGVVDQDSSAPGIGFAREMGAPVYTDFRAVIAEEEIDLIINVTGDPEVSREIQVIRKKSTELVGGVAARFIWELIEARKQTGLLEEKYELALRELETRSHDEFIIGTNPRMRQVSRLIAKVAPAPTTVLVHGESGTGKELVARAIHRQSPRSNLPLVTLNCTALPSALLESELFGYKRGAFTGAYRDQIGLFEKADGGTMFLDEIGDMSLETQAKLLRVLQTGEIRAVGDVKSKLISVRIIAATNRDLKRSVQEGVFREDLYYRINAFTITLPPLRERVEDIPLLAECFLQQARARVNKRVENFSPEAMALLCGYSWPGNLREMQNLIESAVVLTSSAVIETEHLPFPLPEKNMSLDDLDGVSFMMAKARAIELFERQSLSRYLSQTKGNISKASELAGLPRRSFHRLLGKYRLEAHRFKDE